MKEVKARFLDEAAMERVLEKNKDSATELILRLAWNAGLARDEICNLKWDKVSFTQEQLILPDRSIPIDGPLLHCLRLRQDIYGNDSDYVATSDRLRRPMQPETVSRLAKQAMRTEPTLERIRLIDLRHGFILRQLQCNDWRYVARISGISLRTIQGLFMPSAPEPAVSAPPSPATCDEQSIQRAIQETKSADISLALRLIWDLGLHFKQCASLTWEQIRWERHIIVLPDREVPITLEAFQQLQEHFAHRQSCSDAHVLLTPRSKKPYGISSLSKEINSALIKSGIEVPLQDLLQYKSQNPIEEQILQLIQEKKHVKAQDVASYFQLSSGQTMKHLRRLIESGRLVRIGTTYYLAGEIVLPEQHYRVIQAHLRTVGAAYRKELADLLGIGVRQGGWIFYKWVQEGKLVKHGQLYTLPVAENEEDRTSP